MGSKGNGITLWNRNVEKAGDYKSIAHIAPNGKITNYEKRQPKEVTAFIQKIAKGMKDKPKGESVNEFKTIYNKNKAAMKIRSLQRDKGAKVYKVDKKRTKYQGKDLIVYNLFQYLI